MYDVIYIDSHGDETPVAQHMTDRKDAAEVAKSEAAARGAGRMVLPGSRQAAELRLRRAGPARSRIAAPVEPLACRSMRIGVVGGGLMGSGIAEVCARAGVDVTVVEADDERASGRARRSRSRSTAAYALGQALAEEHAAAGERLAYTELASTTSRAPTPRSRRSSRTRTPSASCSSASTRSCPTREFLASNTSSVPIMKLGAGHVDSPSACSACTSSTPCPCCRWSRSCARS